ncbi:MAG: Nif3-like dinuclear metal center hexameric protein [Thermomicrobiaceae bacterium]
MTKRDELIQFCDALLMTEQYRDIALNGLQIEGRQDIQRVTLAVSCNQATIDAAIENDSDAILVHHGLVLNGQVGHIAGPVRRRLKGLLANDINLIGYHLPLDGHPEVGNNVRLAAALNLTVAEPLETYGPPPIGYLCTPESTISTEDLSSRLESVTGQPVITLDGGNTAVERIAVLCGSGSPGLDEAAFRHCQVLITGDAKEPTMAMARELGVTVLVGGHEATERLGVQALAERLTAAFGIQHHFVADPNPL